MECSARVSMADPLLVRLMIVCTHGLWVHVKRGGGQSQNSTYAFGFHNFEHDFEIVGNWLDICEYAVRQSEKTRAHCCLGSPDKSTK